MLCITIQITNLSITNKYERCDVTTYFSRPLLLTYNLYSVCICSLYANITLLSSGKPHNLVMQLLFVSLEIDHFCCNKDRNICIHKHNQIMRLALQLLLSFSVSTRNNIATFPWKLSLSYFREVNAYIRYATELTAFTRI